jgi:hypothetical protein
MPEMGTLRVSVCPSPMVSGIASCDFPEQPRNLSPRLRMHRQQVDDVGPVLTVLVAVAHEPDSTRQP